MNNVLWKTVKTAITYSLILALFALVLAMIVVLNTTPVGHSTFRRTVESVLLLLIYIVAGFACGSLFGLATLHRHVERIVDAVYQSIRGMIIDSFGKIGDGTQSISTEGLRRLLDSDSGVWMTTLAKNFGAAKTLYLWIVRKPVQLMRARIVQEVLPSINATAISMDTLDILLRKHAVQVVRVPLEAKLKMIQYAAVGIGLAALVLPLVIIRCT